MSRLYEHSPTNYQAEGSVDCTVACPGPCKQDLTDAYGCTVNSALRPPGWKNSFCYRVELSVICVKAKLQQYLLCCTDLLQHASLQNAKYSVHSLDMLAGAVCLW